MYMCMCIYIYVYMIMYCLYIYYSFTYNMFMLCCSLLMLILISARLICITYSCVMSYHSHCPCPRRTMSTRMHAWVLIISRICIHTM